MAPAKRRKRKPVYRPTPFGEMVKQWREKHDWSQEELGREAGVAGSYVHHIESGRRGVRPSAGVVWTIAQALDAPVYEFLKAAGWLEPFRDFVNNDPNLTAPQRRVLIRLYDSWMREG